MEAQGRLYLEDHRAWSCGDLVSLAIFIFPKKWGSGEETSWCLTETCQAFLWKAPALMDTVWMLGILHKMTLKGP